MAYTRPGYAKTATARPLPTTRETKLRKFWLILIHLTTIAMVSDYAKRRDALVSTPINPTFFVGEQGRA